MKLQSEFQKFNIEDDQDFRTIFDAVSSDITDKWKDQEDMMILWDSQRKALQSKGPSGRRWHPKVIRVCLSTWTRSPKAYETLRKSGMLILPSGRLLKMYKNSVSQKAGFNDDVLEWMVAEAKKTLGPEGYDGGIIFDEMQIQEDLQLQHEGDETKLIGLVDLGDESDHMKTVIAGIDKAQIASHVLQMVFLGNSGFRFPFAHFPTHEVDAPSLYIVFWQAVKWLKRGGFHALYACCDGGQANRSFIRMHFKEKDPIKEQFTTRNLVTREPFVFFMDPW
ncbi:uncharacterized protein [Ptychodera flava]|uniref:uncharacterized protein n=1 Tax=Ptychodera flava TaxID=63121 RepID=UPI00396A89C0